MDDGPEAAIGLSIAEVTVDGGPVTGPGVGLAVQLGRAAEPARLMVTATAAALLSGSGIELEPVADPAWRLADGSTPSRVLTG
jgi:hypothetical protein